MENISTEEMLTTERENREKDFAILESTEGWSKLAERQRRVIKQSLYVQARAERQSIREDLETPHIIRDQTALVQNGFPPRPQEYGFSQDHIAEWYCHMAIHNMEMGKGLALDYGDLPENFFESDYKTVRTVQELQKWIEEFGFPAILHAGRPSHGASGKVIYAQHSCLVLGHDKNSEIVIWEKEGVWHPYRLSSLDSVYQEYKGVSEWGLRKVAVPLTKTANSIPGSVKIL